MKDMDLTRVALRYNAVYLDIDQAEIDKHKTATTQVLAFMKRLKENGFTVSEQLLHGLYAVSSDQLVEITESIDEIMGVRLNWAPLVKGWQVPTEESLEDHLTTWIANIFGKELSFKENKLPCGHLIPLGTFPLDRYNGCPFCGKPFSTSDYVFKGQGCKLKELRLSTKEDLYEVYRSLLSSQTPLDATQKDSLVHLLKVFEIPGDIAITMKETVMLVIRSLVEKGNADGAASYLKTPTDILRYLWYEKTGYVQLIEPKTLIANARILHQHIWGPLDRGQKAAQSMKERLKLKYDRKACLTVAKWLNDLPMDAEQAAEIMNPKRGMWVRMIRALRLGEYSRRAGFEKLALLLDVFYKQEYKTWQGQVDKARTSNDVNRVLALLKERPGTFVRCLFASMLRFDSGKVLDAFNEVTDKLPARLLLSLGNAAEGYFLPEGVRIAHPITGVTKEIAPNKLLNLYSIEERGAMVEGVNRLYRDSLEKRFESQKTDARTIYVDPTLYRIPISVGDRSSTIQDMSCALMGTRFPVEGNAVRLFMQWGKDLPAQHLDMDLSCRIEYENGSYQECSYYCLTCDGAKHSGDIREIPNKVGTAEYIELSLPELESARARYVMFTCTAYSVGNLSPNLVVGWMDSAYPMIVSETDGVAYDPSCVQHMVRISEDNLSKGLVFGVLVVERREIVWLEMPFNSQTLRGMNGCAAEMLLKKLESKITIGQLLDIKAKAQRLEAVECADQADEAYTYEWALNAEKVTELLVVSD